MSTLEHILGHQRAYGERIYLVPSETSPSITSRIAFLSDVANRYYFPSDTSTTWAFPGNSYLERIYTDCTERLKKCTGATWVNIRPISGSSAMTISLSALGRNGNTVATISPRNGGHSMTHLIAERLGLRIVHLPYQEDCLTEEIAGLAEFIELEQVTFIYLDKCHVLFEYPLEAIRSVVPEHIPIYYDASHVMGLILGNQFQNPLAEGATFMGGSTHKTIPGPHKGFIATNNDEGAIAFHEASAAFVSHDHPGEVAALAMVLEEMENKWDTYAIQTVTNAKHFAARLREKGFKVLAEDKGYTATHQVWIDTCPSWDAHDAVMRLAQCGIITNTFYAPSVPDRLCIRLGVQEISLLGANTTDMDDLAELFRLILQTKQTNDVCSQKVRLLKNRLQPEPDLNTQLEKLIQFLKK